MKSTFFVLLLLFATTHISAQNTRVICGHVTAYNRFPVKNIMVTAKKTKSSVLTDSLGNFSIVCQTKDVIKFSSKVFRYASTKVYEHTDSVLVNLIFVASQKNVGIAVGYGYMAKDDISFALNYLKDENNNFCSYNDIFELIQSFCSGVSIQSGGGSPGASKSVVIRGVDSINLDVTALYVIDGVISDDISQIRPCDVKSISVMKDGTAAIYGSRGANGVVLIELKR